MASMGVAAAPPSRGTWPTRKNAWEIIIAVWIPNVIPQEGPDLHRTDNIPECDWARRVPGRFARWWRTRTDYFPRFVWVRQRWMLVVAALPPAILWIQECGHWLWRWERIGVIPYFFTLLIVVGVPLGLLIRFQRRLYPRVIESDYRLCTECGYSLKGLPATEGRLTCPECGQCDAVDEIRGRWWRWSLALQWFKLAPHK